MKQETFTDIEYSCRKKKTKREDFLEDLLPWSEKLPEECHKKT